MTMLVRIILNLIICAIVIFTIERMMGIFYEKRKTSLRTYIISLLCTFVLLFLSRSARIPPPFDHISDMLVYIVPPFLISLNYKSLFIKRLVVTFSLHLVASMTGQIVHLFAFIAV